MLDYDPLEGYRDAEAYDLEDTGYVADRPLVEELARVLGSPILDIACGTGTMAIHLAQQGYSVTGLDITPEMIDLAVRKATAAGVAVAWHVADARSFQLGKTFAFIYMIGNAFQHMLTRSDHEGLLACVREHLTAEGRFLFGTRNPSPRNLNHARFSEPQTYTQADGTQLIVTEQQRYDPITQIQHYPDGRREEKTERTALRYVFPQEMEALLHYNGFQIEACYGNWEREPLAADSPYMIYVCRKGMGQARTEGKVE